MKQRSRELYETAMKYIPGGVNSPVRAFKSVGSIPIFVSKAAGSRIWDVDGNEYIDYIASWGPMILGHGHPAVVAAIRESSAKGTSYGLPTEQEARMAEAIVDAFPSIDMVRMVSSGTEATMSAIRLARGFTGREKIVKFEGCYHGHSDSLLVKAGSGVATLGIPGSPGVPGRLAELTITLPFNDSEAVTAALDIHGDEIACIIVEPVPGNMGVVLPRQGFLELLREKTRGKRIVLIFDEVITGFRVAYGGYQTVAGIEPDLTCLGKIIGGGLPVGAFGGRREIMEHLAPSGSVYQAGTLSGNPLAMAAGLATLEVLREGNSYEMLEKRTSFLCEEIKTLLNKKDISYRLNRIGSMFTLFFADKDIYDFVSAASSDTKAFARYFTKMLAAGICIAPSQFEAAFVSCAHDDRDIEMTLDRIGTVLSRLT